MSSILAYSTAVTQVNVSSTSLSVAPPAAYQSGGLLVMTVIGGGTAGTAVAAATPSGWTALSSSGAGMGVFWKTAGTEPAAYTITMSATCCAAAHIAAYPAATINSHSFGNSSTGRASYSTTYPSGVGSEQLVLIPAGAVASEPEYNAGYQNVVFPTGTSTQVPAFGPALPNPSPYVYPCSTGLSSVIGSAISGLLVPVFTSPQLCSLYTGFIVITFIGSSSPLAVTATVLYPSGMPGLALTVKALSGAVTSSTIISSAATTSFYANGAVQAPQASITPNFTGSLVYGAVTENIGATTGSIFTANAATTLSQNIADTAWNSIYGTMRSKNATTADVPVTLGGATPVNAFTTVALAEIPAAPGTAVTEVATATGYSTIPQNFATTSVSQMAVFPVAPAVSNLLIAMVSANTYTNVGSSNVTISDTSGFTWIPVAQVTYPSYSGIWIMVPSSSSQGALLSGSGII
jgi:hypothetical protein